MLTTCAVASSASDRRRGLLGCDAFDGALVLERTRSVHTFGMRFPIDVVFCDEHLRVLRVLRLPPNRVTRPVRGARCVVELEAGRARAWGLVPGSRLELRPVGHRAA